MESNEFDFEIFREEAIEKLQAGEGLLGEGGAFTPLLKAFLEKALEGELEAHIAEDNHPNRKNGKGKKIVRTSLGEVQIETPRDRSGTFQPQVIEKRSKNVPKDLEKQILALYARGNSLGDIRDFLEEMYGIEVSPSTLSRVTDKVIPLLEEWRTRPLESVYAFVFMDAIHYKVREEGRVITKAVYGIIGVNQEGYRDVLGLYIGQNESAKFWMNVLTDLQNRGLEDILIASVDNLSGFVEAIEAIYPKTDVQLCIVHQIRNSKKYLSYNDTKEFMADLKTIYQATTREKAEHALNRLEQKWGKQYPKVISSWRRNWENLALMFNYSPMIRKVIYTTNAIEAFHRQLRKVTKTKGSFTSDTALMKLLYLVQKDVTDKWVKPMHNWNRILAQLAIIYDDRLRLDL
ncbi:MAG: IS256 family transposase [Saprospiraceae bacterium]